ncbi:MAG: hypothetical protein RJB31_269 [Bacteroidota bacterium]
MSLLFKNIIRFIFIMFIQIFVLNKIPPLHQFIVPYFYFVFIFWLPFKMGRAALLLISFSVGMVVDMFFKTPGLHAAACVLIAFVRPFLINLLLPKEATDWGNEEPSKKTMGPVPYATYLIILTLLHHFYLILLEWMQFGSFLYFIGKLVATTLISLFLIMIADLFLNRKSKLR